MSQRRFCDKCNLQIYDTGYYSLNISRYLSTSEVKKRADKKSQSTTTHKPYSPFPTEEDDDYYADRDVYETADICPECFKKTKIKVSK